MANHILTSLQQGVPSTPTNRLISWGVINYIINLCLYEMLEAILSTSFNTQLIKLLYNEQNKPILEELIKSEMNRLRDFDSQYLHKEDENNRALRIIEDLYRSIDLFNRTNISCPKFGYSSVKFMESSQYYHLRDEPFKKGFSERNSAHRLQKDEIETELSKQETAENQSNQDRQHSSIKKPKRRLFWKEYYQSQNFKQKPSLTNLNTIRHIKGVVFRTRKNRLQKNAECKTNA